MAELAEQKSKKKSAATSAFRCGSSSRTGKTVIGLDVGYHAAKAAVCRRRNDGWEVLSVDQLRFEKGDADDPEACGTKLVPWLKQLAREQSATYIATLPSYLFDYETMEVAEPDELAEAATQAMQELLGDDLDNAAYDFWTNEEQSKLRLHLVWTMGNFATSVTQSFAGNGLHCRGLDAPVVALARVRASSPSANSRLIVDIGSSEATFVLSRFNQAIYFRNRIRFAERSAAESIARLHDISVEAAEVLLGNYGIATTAPQPNPISILLQRGLEDWTQNLLFEIQRTTQFISARWGENAIEEIVFCGGGATIGGLDAELGKHLSIPIRNATLPEGWSWRAGQPYSPLFAQALALAEYGD